MNSQNTLYYNGYFLSQPYTGTGLVTAELLKHIRLQAPDQRIVLLFMDGQVVDPESFAKTFSCEVEVVQVSKKYPDFMRRFVWEFFKIPAFFKAKKEGTYFSTFLHPMLSFPGKSIKYVMMLHDIFPWKYPNYATKITRKLYNLLMKRSIKHPRLTLVTVSDTSKSDIEAYFHLTKDVHVVKNGVDHVKAYPLETYEELVTKFQLQKPYIFYMGGYDTRKRVNLLIEAFKQLHREHRDITLVLGGNALYKSGLYTDLEIALKGVPNVIHTGFLSSSDMKSLYHYASVIAHSTADEGFNVAIGEALMEHVPVVASDIPVHRELWKPWVELVDFTNTKKVCTLLKEVIYSPEYQHKEMTTTEENIYTWNNSARQLLRLL